MEDLYKTAFVGSFVLGGVILDFHDLNLVEAIKTNPPEWMFLLLIAILGWHGMRLEQMSK